MKKKNANRIRHKSSCTYCMALLIALISGAAASPLIFVEAAESREDVLERENLTYVKTGPATAAVKAGRDLQADVVVPASLEWDGKSYAVTSIESSAFIGSPEIRSIQLPKGMTKIDAKAFAMCTSLEQVVLPETLTSIGREAFSNCVKLKEINLSSSLETIGESAFEGCSSLEALQIPSSVRTIGDCAFFNCSKLSRVIFDGNDVHLGRNLFSGRMPELFGTTRKVPAFLIPYQKQYQGVYNGENLNRPKTGEWVYMPAENVWRWKTPEGSFALSCWIEQPEGWFYVDEKGNRQTGLQTIDGQTYYFDDDGRMLTSSWVQEGRDWLYMDEEGHMAADTWQPYEGFLYYLQQNGILARSRFVLCQDGCVFVNADGQLLENDRWGAYYFGKDGRPDQTFMRITENSASDDGLKTDQTTENQRIPAAK